METLWKIVFYILNFTVYLFLIWWIVNKHLLTTVVGVSLGNWIFCFVLIFLVVSSVGYWVAQSFWDSGYWGMFFKNVGIFFFALFVLFFKATVEFDVSDLFKPKTKFEWNVSVSGSKYYTIYNIKTKFICDDKSPVYVLTQFPSIYEEWGQYGSIELTGRKRSLPTQLYTQWLSCTEGESGQIYEAVIDLPYDTILNIFQKGYIYQEPDGKISQNEYSNVVVGLAPGGVVSLWICGSYRRVQVGYWLAHKLPSNDEIFASRGGQHKLTKQLLSRHLDYIPDYIKNQVVSEKQWVDYNNKYLSRYKIKFESEDVDIVDVKTEYYNGELYHLYPFNDTVYYQRACPKRIYIGWKQDENIFDAFIQFDKEYLFNNIDKLNERPNSKMDFVFNINKCNNKIECYLSNQIDTIELPDKYRKIKIFMNRKGIYSNYPGEGQWYHGYNYE